MENALRLQICHYFDLQKMSESYFITIAHTLNTKLLSEPQTISWKGHCSTYKLSECYRYIGDL